MQHYSNTARRRLLFCVPVEEAISDNRVLGQSWDVMDQFPPCNSHDKDGSLLFKRICVEGMSPRKEVQREADPSSAPQLDAKVAPTKPGPDSEMFSVLRYSGIPITKSDLKRLEPGIFLNDNLISLALTVWLDGLQISEPVRFGQIHLLSTFFYKKLCSGTNPQNCYDLVSRWTTCNIFQKKYIIVPINQDFHWYLAIIYEPEHVLRSPHGEQNGANTYIFTFDSLGGSHPLVVERLSSYLRMEAKFKKGSEVTSKVHSKAASVPQQPNDCDCGIYLIHFAQTFLSDPEKYANIIVHRPPEYINKNARDTIWLVDRNGDFEVQKRNELHSKIEALSIDWKYTPQPELEYNSESEGEVECL